MSECATLATSPAMSAVANACFGLFLGALRLASSPPTTTGYFLSPLSIVYALMLAINGAGPNSTTQTELLHVVAGPSGGVTEAALNSDLSAAMELLNGHQCGAGGGPSSEMVLANSVWTHGGTELKPDYVQSMQSLFQATARVAVNGTADVNAWVSNATRGLITDLIKTENFAVVLANALYFKGQWQHAFKKELTQPGPFVTSAGENKQVPMMSQLFEGRNAADVKVLQKAGKYDAVQLPYSNGTFAAVALLPAPGVNMTDAISDWATTGGLQVMQQVRSVNVTLPRFSASSEVSLVPVLQGLGVQAAFSPKTANFSRMAVGSQLYISDVLHKAVVEVDEEGTVAAAASAVVMLGNSLAVPLPPLQLVFDRPFAFLIYHSPTGLPVFSGVVNDPSSAA